MESKARGEIGLGIVRGFTSCICEPNPIPEYVVKSASKNHTGRQDFPAEDDVINGTLYLLHAMDLVEPTEPINPERGAVGECLRMALICYVEDREADGLEVALKILKLLEVLE